MTLLIDRFVRENASPSPETIESFLHAHRFPIIEGPNATFVFFGDADEVRFRHWIFSLESSRAFERLKGTDFWYLTEQLPAGSRVEYKLEVRRGDRRSLIRDP
ncbi:MAG: enterochelin esterase, partial [Thermoanaerobaculia bacterium]|nr:enterochelin esterase [Thermoanaerobaculia bacterium]